METRPVITLLLVTGITYYIIQDDLLTTLSWWCTATIYRMLAYYFDTHKRKKEPRTVRTSSPSDCLICLEEIPVGPAARLDCSCTKVYHRECLSQWMRVRPYCPICRYSSLV